jgi:uncharacterized protein Usg
MADPDFIKQLDGYGLTTAEIQYRLPDQLSILQLFIWQQYDLAPGFPTLMGFLEFWQREIEGPLHAVRVAHKKLIRPAEFRAVNGVLTIH